jgi:hypothetical protein
VVEWQTRGSQKAVPITRREGSSPSLVTGACCPGGERDIMAPSEGAGPGSIPGRGTVVASMVKGRSRGSAKAEFLVRVQVGALWPNSKRQRDPAVNRGCAGSTPAGHPRGPVQLDGTSTPLLKGSVRVRVPPLVLDYRWARPSAGDGGSEPRSSWLDTSTGCSGRPAMLDRPGTALVTRTKWVRVPPPALDPS